MDDVAPNYIDLSGAVNRDMIAEGVAVVATEVGGVKKSAGT